MSHSEKEQLLTKLEEAKKQVDIGGHYVHYKHPEAIYVVTGFGIDEDTEDVRVEYERIDENPAIPWRRKLVGIDGWLTKVEVNGQLIPRFQKVT
jgi:hypothetical protein